MESLKIRQELPEGGSTDLPGGEKCKSCKDNRGEKSFERATSTKKTSSAY